MAFLHKLLTIAQRHQSWLCVGLDSELSKLPVFLRERHGPHAVLEFNRAIIEATSDLVCAYKPNLAFYEMLGPVGLEMLSQTRELIPKEIPVIADAKRGDIENTARAYAHALFEHYRFDAVTVNPLQGFDAIAPFSEYRERGVFVLVRTSNPSAREIQDLECAGKPLYQHLAERARAWNAHKNIGVVVGATAPNELAIVRQIIGEEMPILVPGVGAQAGDLERAVQKSVNSQGELAIITVSRSVIFASQGEDFAQAARKTALRLRDAIVRARR
ncbi:orotidine-5'-phosphate decarboxylase [Candidatus Acetothermia bacterium]|jgi:orotidine-5'-phosphate decarboxylase|nr:orotidine-5'-phosphate decarboxylase [Candidatus Acetothermia bacterium]MCI2431654.1 orotidine-5'-phosphate decarboxylase [Candidatus Acetothermia bacterium]MCI2436370.1 orotidine-5'-phosphate decarboxylase [Candidatus Acetothermia bacterium]